jgi:hypothetical protein
VFHVAQLNPSASDHQRICYESDFNFVGLPSEIIEISNRKRVVIFVYGSRSHIFMKIHKTIFSIMVFKYSFDKWTFWLMGLDAPNMKIYFKCILKC